MTTIALIQLGLAAQGFEPGPVDGLLGLGTRRAIRQWQVSRGEAGTGFLDAESAKVLLADGERHQTVAALRRHQEQIENHQREQETAARARSEKEVRERSGQEALVQTRQKAEGRAPQEPEIRVRQQEKQGAGLEAETGFGAPLRSKMALCR